MAAKSGGMRSKTKQNPTCLSASKLPLNPVCRLQYRELGGIHRHHRQNVSSQIYQKLPGRLAFSLSSLVDEAVLHEGHVFLGFTKSGDFVLSYTLHVEADEHTAYPIYVYRLQWWQFIPYKRLKKVGEVRLFGEEEIQRDMFLAVCEWPTDDSRVVVHGYCSPSDNEEKHQCYVTITAIPPIEPCEECSQLAILQLHQAAAGYAGSVYAAPPRCINHAFTVHTKYELAPPYPSFAPKVFLKLDGVVIVNTGDSLVAMSVDIEDNHGGFGFGLYSPRITRSMSNLSSTSSGTEADDQISCDSQDHFSDARPFDEVAEFSTEPLLNILSQSACANPSSAHRNPPTPKDTTNNPSEYRTPPEYKAPRERHTSTGKENLLCKQMGSPLPNMDSGGGARVPRTIDVYNFEGGTPKKEEDSAEYYEVVQEPGGSGSQTVRQTTVRTALSFTGYQHGARLQNRSGSSSSEEIQLLHNDTTDSQPIDESSPSRCEHSFEKPTSTQMPRAGGSAALGGCASQRSMAALSLITPEALPYGKTLAFSPGYGKWEPSGSSSCSSCVSSPIILQSESQCFTYSVRRYVDAFTGRPESPVEVEDDLNLAYHSLLPLEVHGANYSHMRLLTKQCHLTQMPCIVVKQLTLDIEHFLGETVRTCAEWGSRYLAFTDYDVQIVEVCPETSEVIAIVFALIRAKPPKEKKHAHGMRAVPKLYKTGCKLIWNLKTGSYNTLDVDDLVEVNQQELIRKRWHPGQNICEALQRRFAVPQVYSRSVHVLANEAVFRGQSLKILLDRHHYVAILL